MQTRRQLLQEWDQQLRALLPGVRVTQVAVLACLSLGLLWSGRVTLSAVAASLPLPARDLSVVRRLRRWVANPRVAVGRLWPALLAPLLAGWAGRDLLLVLDPTPLDDRLTLCLLGLVLHKRILPLAWHPLPMAERWPASLATVLRHLTAALQPALPPGAGVTLLADRGLTSAALIDRCRALGWHFVLRVTATARTSPIIRLADDTCCPLWSLVTGPGQRWSGTVACYQAAGWRTVELTIHWARGAREPWVLLSDRPAGPDRVREYRRRVRGEATYQDCKGRGWDLARTKLTARARLNRLLLALFLALWWAETLGLRVVRRGLRWRYDRSDRRDRSLVRLGRRWLADLHDHGRLPPLLFRWTPDGWLGPSCR